MKLLDILGCFEQTGFKEKSFITFVYFNQQIPVIGEPVVLKYVPVGRQLKAS